MKKLILLALIAIFALSMLLIGCGTKTETTTTAPATQTVTATATVSTTATKTATTTATTTTTATKPVPEGTINVGLATFSYEQWDETLYTAAPGAYALYDTLVMHDKDGNYIGDVAQSWEIGADGNTWTFHIRKDIVFHDGTKLTAKDVKFSVDHFASANSTNPWSPYLTRNYVSTKVVDDYTFQYVTARPEPTLIIAFEAMFVIPADYYQSVGQAYFAQHPIGTGPWKMTAHEPQVSVTFEANIHHFRDVPTFQYLKYLQVPEEATRIAMYKRGELDIATGISTDRLVEMKKAGSKTIIVGLPATYTIIWPGTWINKGPTSDIRVRQAMSYALNRQEMCDTFFQGTAVPGGRWFIAPGGFGWDNSWKPDPYDPAKAKQLLAAAGYPGAFTTPTINFYITATQSDFAQVLQGYWQAVGLDVKINVMENVAWSGIVFVRNTDPKAPQAGGMWMWGPFPVVPNAIYHSANMYTSGGVHTTGNDPQADALYKKATAELNPTLQRQDWTDFLNYAYNMWVNTGTVLIQPLTLVSNEIGAIGRDWINLDDSLATIQHAK